MRNRQYFQVDVFTATAYQGNPLAVVLDGSELDDSEMQHFAAWTNLSETAFLLPPTHDHADYRVRIFTPATELPFAGHPTLGSGHAWLQAGGQARNKNTIVQQCEIGQVEIRQQGARLAFAAPPLKRTQPAPDLLGGVAQALGLQAGQILDAQLLDNGPLWLGLLLNDPATVLQLSPDHLALQRLGHKVGVAAIYQDQNRPFGASLIKRSSQEALAFSSKAGNKQGSETPQLEVRAFTAPAGILEDPVTGSLNASLAQWLIDTNRLPQQYIAAQGACLGRAGRVYIERDSQEQVWVGGHVTNCITGSVLL